MKSAHTYVLVHGAWHGGWCWRDVANRLRAAGHQVHTPTLTGLGERSHLNSGAVTLDTFIQDIVNVLRWEDLHDVTLVGHSFAGLVISAVADRMPERLARLIYLDAFIMPPGTSVFETLPAGMVAKMERKAAEVGGLPPPPPHALGLDDEGDARRVQSRLTPHPIGTYRETFSLRHPLGNGIPATYIRCTQPPFAAVEQAFDWARKNTSGWRWRELASSHDAMISDPDAVADILMETTGHARAL